MPVSFSLFISLDDIPGRKLNQYRAHSCVQFSTITNSLAQILGAALQDFPDGGVCRACHIVLMSDGDSEGIGAVIGNVEFTLVAPGLNVTVSVVGHDAVKLQRHRANILNVSRNYIKNSASSQVFAL